MVGLRPVVEMMTFNFALVAIDQIVNHAAKILYMSGGQYRVPMVIRGPGGFSVQVAAQHSQSMESYFYHVPGLIVVRPSTPKDAKGLLKSAIRDDNPVIFIESETIYGMKGEVPEEEYTIPLGVADVKREGTDVTVVAWMGMLHRTSGGRRRAGEGRHLGRGGGSPDASADGQGDDPRLRFGRRTARWSWRPVPGSPGSGRRSAPSSPRRPSTIWTPRSCG